MIRTLRKDRSPCEHVVSPQPVTLTSIIASPSKCIIDPKPALGGSQPWGNCTSHWHQWHNSAKINQKTRKANLTFSCLRQRCVQVGQLLLREWIAEINVIFFLKRLYSQTAVTKKMHSLSACISLGFFKGYLLGTIYSVMLCLKTKSKVYNKGYNQFLKGQKLWGT